MECDPTRVCELIVGLGDVEVLGVDDEQDAPLRAHVRRRAPRPNCVGCGGPLWSNGERPVELVDLPAFGRPVRLTPRSRPRGSGCPRGRAAGRRARGPWLPDQRCRLRVGMQLAP